MLVGSGSSDVLSHNTQLVQEFAAVMVLTKEKENLPNLWSSQYMISENMTFSSLLNVFDKEEKDEVMSLAAILKRKLILSPIPSGMNPKKRTILTIRSTVHKVILDAMLYSLK